MPLDARELRFELRERGAEALDALALLGHHFGRRAFHEAGVFQFLLRPGDLGAQALDLLGKPLALLGGVDGHVEHELPASPLPLPARAPPWVGAPACALP